MIQRLQTSFICLTACVGLLALTGCGADESYSEYERTEAQFNAELGGDISTLQWWKTAVELKVKVTTNTPVKLWVLSAEKGGTLYGYAEIEESEQLAFTIPQTGSGTVYLIAYDGRKLHTTNVILSGKLTEYRRIYRICAQLLR